MIELPSHPDGNLHGVFVTSSQLYRVTSSLLFTSTTALAFSG
jgi:hypothetical protein